MIHASGPIAAIVIGALLVAGGWFTAFSLGKPLRDRAAASINWPTTEGRITRSQLERSKKEGRTMYSADVAYEYVLDGKTFGGDRVWFGDNARSSDPTAWKRAVERYPMGSGVQVHYDPDDPQESVLEPGLTWAGSVIYLVGLGILALGGLIVLSAMLPLLLAIAAILSRPGRRPRDPRDDFGAGHADHPARGDDDGITIR